MPLESKAIEVKVKRRDNPELRITRRRAPALTSVTNFEFIALIP